MDFSPNGQRLALQGKDGAVSLWDWSGKQLVKIIKGQPKATTSLKAISSLKDIWLRESSSILRASFSPNGERIVSIGKDGTARLWDMSGRQVTVLRGHQEMDNVTFSPDGQHLTSVGEDGTVRLWNLSGQQVGSIEERSGQD